MSSTSSTPEQSAAPTIKRHRRDPYIWGSYIALLFLSVIELYSASIQEVRTDDIFGPIKRHGLFLLLGLGIVLVFERIHFSKLFKYIPWYVLGSIILMFMVLFVGTNVNGAARAIKIFGIMILPAEFLKLAAALGVAWILSRTQVRYKNGEHDVTNLGVITSATLVLLCSGLLFSHGLTNTLLLMSISICMMLVGGISWRKLFYVFIAYIVIGGAAVGIKYALASEEKITDEQIENARLDGINPDSLTKKEDRIWTWIGRIERHLDPNKHLAEVTDENKQEQLSYMAQARGGLINFNIGGSRENARLPLAFSDYIFAIIVEEMGAIPALFILVLYLFLLGRAGRLSMVFKSTPPCLLVIGCALVICLQALFHICIVVGVFPVSGQPLPLISKGGISILATSMALGLMLSASRWAARKDDSEENIQNEREVLPEKIATDNPSQI